MVGEFSWAIMGSDWALNDELGLGMAMDRVQVREKGQLRFIDEWERF